MVSATYCVDNGLPELCYSSPSNAGLSRFITAPLEVIRNSYIALGVPHW